MFESKVILTRKEYDELISQIQQERNRVEEIKRSIFEKCYCLSGENIKCLLSWDNIKNIFPKDAEVFEEETKEKAKKEWYRNV